MASFNFTSDKKPLTTFGMAGLADIVLLLLIFFLLTSNFIPQFGIQVNLPQADALAPNEPNHISVAVTKDGRFYVDQNEVTRENLFETIRVYYCWMPGPKLPKKISVSLNPGE